MPLPQDPRRGVAKNVVALLLSFVAGFVDIVGFVAVYHIFTAHMTGTTVHLGQELVTGQYTAAVIAATVLAAFMLGSIAGRVLIEIGSRRHVHRVASVTLAIEAALLAGFVSAMRHAAGPLSPPSVLLTCVLLAMLASAMGLQTATLTRIGPLTIHTTFVTGMLNKLAQLISHLLFRTVDLFSGKDKGETVRLRQERAAVSRQAGFIFAIWFVYLAGAISGAWLHSKNGVTIVYIPVGILLMAIAADQVRPLSIEEERDQSER
jgi:uncharacterized membrane protein YoaK (UPF0700 family)